MPTDEVAVLGEEVDGVPIPEEKSSGESETAENSKETGEKEVEPEAEAEEKEFEGVDPNKLPPELQKIVKGFQGSYTKKMQALQEALDSLSPHKDRLELFDRAIKGDPEALQAIQRIAGVQNQPQRQPQQDDEQFYKDIPADFQDTKTLVKFLDSRFGGFLNTYMQKYLPQLVAPALAPVQQMREQAARAQFDSDVNRLRSENPDFDSHVDKMIELRQQNPNLTLEAAYKLATWRKPTPPQKLVSKPGSRPGAVSDGKGGEPLSWEQSVGKAIRELKRR